MEEEAFLQSIGGSYSPQPVKQKTFAGKLIKGAADVGIGFLKGAGDTIGSVPKNVEKVVKNVSSTSQTKAYAGLLDDINAQNQKLLNVVQTLDKTDPKREKYMGLIRQNQEQANALREDFYGTGGVQDTIQNSGMTNTINKLTTPTSGAQRFGKGVEKVGEFFVGGNAATKLIPKGTGALSRVASNTAQGVVGGGLPTLGASAVEGQFDTKEGTTNAFKQAGVASATSGILSGGLSAAGEALRASKLPSRLMSGIYKTEKKQVAQLFDQADEAIPEKGKKLSQWAVDKGLKGNIESQAKQVSKILKDSEEKVISSAEAAKTRIPVQENLFKLAQQVQDEYRNIGRGEISQVADDFLRDVKDNSVSVKSALKLRRELDKLRPKLSFSNPAMSDNLAYWAEDLRKSVNAIDNIGSINKDYAQAIKAREALIKAATSRENQKALGALEAYVIGGGMVTGQGAPALATVIGKRLTQSPRVTSRLASSIQNAKPSKIVRLGASKIAGDSERKSQERKTLEELFGK